MQILFEELSRIRETHRNERIVLAGGCYDLLHVGHVAYLEKCRALGDILVVAASSDARIRERKGVHRPIIPEHDRVTMLSSLTCVDYALVAPNPTSGGEPPTVTIIKTLQPDIFATSDMRMNEYSSDLSARGVQATFVPEVRLTSTSDIIAKIQSAVDG